MPPKRLLKLNISSGGDPQDRPDETPEPKKVPDRIVQVDDHLFLSGAKAASNIDSLRENKINVIISMIHTKDMQLFPEEIIYIENPIADNASQDITGVLREIPARIADHIQAGRNVLVHCQEVNSTHLGHLKSPHRDHRLSDDRKRTRL